MLFASNISFRANLIYNISMKGSKAMIQTEQIRNLFAGNDGVFVHYR